MCVPVHRAFACFYSYRRIQHPKCRWKSLFQQLRLAQDAKFQKPSKKVSFVRLFLCVAVLHCRVWLRLCVFSVADAFLFIIYYYFVCLCCRAYAFYISQSLSFSFIAQPVAVIVGQTELRILKWRVARNWKRSKGECKTKICVLHTHTY